MSREEERLKLHYMLVEALGSENVYFQPPPSHMMQYPCIRYYLSDVSQVRANNKSYIKNLSYTATFMTKNQITDVPERLEEIPYCVFDRCYISDNLYHFVYTINILERTKNHNE